MRLVFLFLLVAVFLVPAPARAAETRGEAAFETLPLVPGDALKDADKAPGWLPAPAETNRLPKA